MNNISLIIPIYNEEENILRLFKEIVDSGVYSNLNQIIFVDDFSSDNSLKILKKLKEENKKIHILTHSKNMGQSYCLKTAAEIAKTKDIITIDGDCQNNPKDIHKLIDLYFSDNNLYLVGGIRIKRKDSLIKVISSKIANKIRMLILNDDCTDTGCSLKIFDRNTFLQFPFFNGIHRFLPALFKGYGKKTSFITVDHRPRLHGYSKYDTFGRLMMGIKDIILVIKILKRAKKKL